MRILSYDCANKSLGVVGVIYDPQWDSKIAAKIRAVSCLELHVICQALDDIIADLYNVWQITYIGLFDLIPGKKVKDTTVKERCTMLKNKVCEINAAFPTPDLVLVEDQMSLNEKSRGVFYCLAYEYANIVHCIKAVHKNKNMNFGAGPLQDFIVKYNTPYDANKNHVSDNFRAYLKQRDQLDFIIGYKVIKDIGDAFFQIVAHCKMQQ